MISFFPAGSFLLNLWGKFFWSKLIVFVVFIDVFVICKSASHAAADLKHKEKTSDIRCPVLDANRFPGA